MSSTAVTVAGRPMFVVVMIVSPSNWSRREDLRLLCMELRVGHQTLRPQSGQPFELVGAGCRRSRGITDVCPMRRIPRGRVLRGVLAHLVSAGNEVHEDSEIRGDDQER